jgi:hypothetical protein
VVKLKGEAPKPEGATRLIQPNEIVNVRLSAVERRDFQWEGEDRKRLRWEFMVTDEGPWKGKMIWGETSTNYVAHPNCKAYNWAATFLGHQPDVSEGLDTDDLIGLPCRILIYHKTDGQGRTWMRAKEVLPPKAAPVLGPQDAPF